MAMPLLSILFGFSPTLDGGLVLPFTQSEESGIADAISST